MVDDICLLYDMFLKKTLLAFVISFILNEIRGLIKKLCVENVYGEGRLKPTLSPLYTCTRPHYNDNGWPHFRAELRVWFPGHWARLPKWALCVCGCVCVCVVKGFLAQLSPWRVISGKPSKSPFFKNLVRKKWGKGLREETTKVLMRLQQTKLWLNNKLYRTEWTT